MSLLLDARKKAAAATREPVAGGRESAELTLTELAAASPPAAATEIPLVDAALTSAADAADWRPKPPHHPPQPAAERNHAGDTTTGNAAAAKRIARSSRRPILVAGIVTLAIGAGFGWQLQPSAGVTPTAPQAPAAPATQTFTTVQTAPAAQTAPPVPQPPADAPLHPKAPALAAAPITGYAADAKVSQQQSTPRNTDEENPVRITRERLRIHPGLAQAYARLQAGDADGATEAYAGVLHSDPHNADALLGMASAALHHGQPKAAESWYLRAIEADPLNVHAQAGLLSLRGLTDPVATENRLKGLLAAQPDTAMLHFTLGNLYAGQRRWAEAQQAYFDAHAADSGNPDYLFNLAVGLDHLHLPQPARTYYQAALAAAAGGKAAFEPAQVRARLAELAPCPKPDTPCQP